MNIFDEYKDTFLSACNKMLDICLDAIDQINDCEDPSPALLLDKANFEKTAKEVEAIKQKITKKEPFSKKDYHMLMIILTAISVNMQLYVEQFQKAANEMNELVKKVQILAEIAK